MKGKNCKYKLVIDCVKYEDFKQSSFSADSPGLLDGLDFLQQESSDDSGLDAASAKDTSVGSRDGLLSGGELLVGEGSQLSNTIDSLSAVARVVRGPRSVSSLLNVLNHYS